MLTADGNAARTPVPKSIGKMAPSWRCWWWKLGLASLLAMAGAVATFGDCALAQITPDGTLGDESSVVKPTNINGLPSDQIDGGAIRGPNLFHSFREFNISEGRGAYFTNPDTIQNILSRVTGNDPSDILGRLGVLGNANLFLINPNGIVFGPNASLDVGGSFVATTADSLIFQNGFEFSAANPEAPPLLTINLRPGLQYGSNQPGATIANAENLAVGQNLMLGAGNLDLQGQLHAGENLTLQATDTVRVRDSVANPFIASASGKLLVQGNQGVDIFALNHPSSGLFSGKDMVLRSANQVGGDAHYWSGGNFRIEQLDGNLGDLYSPYDPIIFVAGDLFFNNYIGASLHILAGGSVVVPGTIVIIDADTPSNSIAENITLSDGTVLSIDGSARPTLDIRTGVDPSIVSSPDRIVSIGSGSFFGGEYYTTPSSAGILIGSVIIEQSTVAHPPTTFRTRN